MKDSKRQKLGRALERELARHGWTAEAKRLEREFWRVGR